MIWQTLQQGLVTPGESIRHLIAMTTDVLPLMRTRTENLIKEIDVKYGGMVSVGVFVFFSDFGGWEIAPLWRRL